jgi:hypothetical protein
VLQAKAGFITEGHYSRFGFHHPGPAFLYSLAISEILFFDLLGWVPSAFSATAVFIVALSWMNVQVFNSAWFPYMCALPFAAFVTALAVALRGEGFGLPIAAVFGGFLINGHASFLFIVPSIGLAVLALNFLLTVKDRDNRIFSRS